MAVNLMEPSQLLNVDGVELGVAQAGIRYADRDDVLLMRFVEGALTSAVFTQNVFCAAPVHVAKSHIASMSPRALLINSGNANAVTGDQGMRAAQDSCSMVAKVLGCEVNEVLPFSTGVIGEQLPMAAMQSGIDLAVKNLQPTNWLNAAKAIMTTDTLPKAFSEQVVIGGEKVTVTGISKGSGMICPNMATMLAYIVTDAKVNQSTLDKITTNAANESFNSISVDGDTSTNDAFVVTATQCANNMMISEASSLEKKQLQSVVTRVAQKLAQAIVRDGEGATKFVEVNVSGGDSLEDCASVAYTLAHSPLVKTALFASDPNWGRLLMAIGRAPVSKMDSDKVNVRVNGLAIVSFGQPDTLYSEEKGQAVFNESELVIDVELGDSLFQKTVWTTDLSHEYVTINAEYRS